jgi:hypothetical protein
MKIVNIRSGSFPKVEVIGFTDTGNNLSIIVTNFPAVERDVSTAGALNPRPADFGLFVYITGKNVLTSLMKNSPAIRK